VWIGLWGGAVVLLLPVMWVATLVRGEPIRGLHEMFGMYVRYTLHVYAYASLAADPFPPFLGPPGRYPVDLVVPAPAPQSRWSVGFRLVLALPPYLFASALGSGVATAFGTALTFSLGLGVTAMVLGWFATLARGRMPAGLRDVLLWTLGYGVQVAAYVLLVTGAYPDSDPRAAPLTPRPRHPVRLDATDERRRHRLLVLFRFPLAAPHTVWSALWGVAALLAGVVAWLCGIALGRVPGPLHRFLAAYVRYQAHVSAFLYLAGGPFPGFLGRRGTYPVDLGIDGPGRQSRWSIAFRWLLALPALALAGSASTLLSAGAVGAWWWSMVKGEMPRGLHRALQYGVRYSGQVTAYCLLVTGAYPHSGPSEAEAPAAGADRWLVAPEAP